MATVANLDIMVKEFEDHSQDIEKRLLAIENKKLKKVDIEEISRILHSYKGLMSFLGEDFAELVQLIHTYEDKFLEEQKEKKLSPEFFQELISLVDSIRKFTELLPKSPSKSQVKALFPKLTATTNTGLKLEKEYKLELYVDENLKMKSSKILSMINILKQICTINDSNPSSDMLLDNYDTFTQVDIFITTKKAENEIKAIIQKFHDVRKFELKEQTMLASSKPEEIVSSKVAKLDYAINSHEMTKISGILEEFIRMEKVMKKVEIIGLPKHEQQLLSSFKRKVLEIQESITISKELPLKVALDPLPRLVRDISKKYGKIVEFYTAGEEIPVNRSILEKLTDPLIILLNNSIAHGIETEVERKKAKKNGSGIIRIEARQNQGTTTIRVFDNGRGIDFKEIWKKGVELGFAEGEYSETKAKQILFLPGFSTMEEVSEIAGRGVGLSQVRKFIIDMNGKLSISTNLGKNTVFEMTFPVQNSIASTILVDVGGYQFGFPETHIRKIIRLREDDFETCDIDSTVFAFFMGESVIKTINLAKIFDQDAIIEKSGSILLWNNGLEEIAFFVNDVITFEEMAINYSDPVADISPLFAGTASVGSGDIVFLLQPQAFMESYNL